MESSLQTEVPTTSDAAGLDALLHSAAFAPIRDLGWLRITGADRVRWLNGMVTNSIATLQPGQGCYNFFLNAQGRIQGDGTAFATPDAILVQTSRERLPHLITLLDHFIIMDEVELTDASADWHGLQIAGPNATSILEALGAPSSTGGFIAGQGGVGIGTAQGAAGGTYNPKSPGAPSIATLHRDGWDPIELIQAHSALVPRLELWTESPTTLTSLEAHLTSAGATQASTEAFNLLRILEGTPLYGTDIRDKELPQETGQTRALHFAKGCYLGQEIVERIRSRGNVHRTFHGFTLTGDLPPAGTPLEFEGKAVGELTSVAAIPLRTGTLQLALGYIRREALDRNQPLTYLDGSATPSNVPFSTE